MVSNSSFSCVQIGFFHILNSDEAIQSSPPPDVPHGDIPIFDDPVFNDDPFINDDPLINDDPAPSDSSLQDELKISIHPLINGM
jgi:hypothetical protein